MDNNVIPMRRHAKEPTKDGVPDVTIRTPIQIFEIRDNGQIDLVDGLAVTDAVAALWDSIQGVTREAWEGGPLARERARVAVLTAYLDKVRPNWKVELDCLL